MWFYAGRWWLVVIFFLLQINAFDLCKFTSDGWADATGLSTWFNSASRGEKFSASSWLKFLL
jgi:hypothetical protein